MNRSNTKQLLFLGLVPLGIVLLIFSIKLVKKTYSGRIILEIPYALKSAEFILDKPGNYSIWHSGQFFRKAPLEEFRPKITDLSDGCNIELSARLFRPHANNGRNARMEIFRFSAPAGKYRLEVKEGTSISRAEQKLIDAIPAGRVDENKYYLQVRESQPLLLSLSGIAGIALGGICITGGLVTGILSLKA